MLYKIIRVNRLYILPEKCKGVAIGCFVFIKKDSDNALLQHELVHVRQFWRNPLMPLLYLLSKRKRYQYEIEAYRESIRCGRKPIECAYSIVNNYRLNVLAGDTLADLIKKDE